MIAARLVLVALAAATIACSSDDNSVQVSVTPGPSSTGQGTVSASDAILCQFNGTATTGVCNTTLDQGGSLELVAVAGQGSSFMEWLGDCTGTTTCTLNLARGRAVQAVFAVNDLVTVGNAAGSTGILVVTSSPPGIDCTLNTSFSNGFGNCEAGFPRGSSVVLTATPDEYSGFDSWSGGCTGTSCTLTMSGPVGAAARSHGSFPLTIVIPVGNAGSGTVTSTPAGINCTVVAAATSGTCTASFTGGTVVSLVATPASGSLFAYWNGVDPDFGCGVDPTCPVGMNGSRDIPANFSLAP